jgi:hypothetical protein
MWARGIVGIVFFLTGLVWIGQGTNLISNSKLMSGHGQYTLLGILVLLVGMALIVWAARIRRARIGQGTGP